MDLPINANRKLGSFEEILIALKDQMDAMLSHFSRVMFLRLDIRQHEYHGDNKAMSDFLRKLKKRLSRHYKIKRIAHLWAREQETAAKQHYHLVLMLDGHTARHPSKMIRLVEDIAEKWDWPKPYTPQHCYYLIHRGNQAEYNAAFKRGSYLAKVRGKGKQAPASNNYNRSHIKPPA